MEESLNKANGMEEKALSNVSINIYGGTNQILPNAIKAEQHFHYGATYGATQPMQAMPDSSSRSWQEDDERRLSLYIEKEERLQAYIATLAACTTAQQVGEAVADMCANEPKLNADLIAKEKFICLLQPFLTGIDKGKGIDNLRIHINDAWNRRKKQLQSPVTRR